MSVARLLTAWALGLAAVAVSGGSDPGSPLTSLHPTALVGLCLLFVVGVPTAPPPSERRVPLPLALGSLAPLLSLAAAIDAARDRPEPAWTLAGAVAVLAALLARASSRAAHGRSASLGAGLFFWGFACGLPLLAAALAWAGRPGEAPAALSGAVGWSPLGFAFGAAGEGPLPEPTLAWLAPILAAGLGTLAVELGARGARLRGLAPAMLAAVAGLGLAARAEAADSRLFPAEIELVGPLDSVLIDGGRAGTTTLAVDLEAGQRRTFTLPVPILNETARELGGPPPVRALGGGSATFGGWSEDHPSVVAWSRLPRGLVSRPPPAPAARLAGWTGAAILVLAAGLWIGVAARGRDRMGLVGLVGLQLALAALIAVAPGFFVRGADSGPVEVTDVDLDAGAAARTTAARERLDLPDGGLVGRLETVPPGGALAVELSVVEGRVAGSVTARGSILVARAAAPGSAAELLRDEGGDRLREWSVVQLASADRSWRRLSDGGWSGEEELPPAWAAAGLPPGVPGMLIDRAGSRSWWRMSGRVLEGLDLPSRDL